MEGYLYKLTYDLLMGVIEEQSVGMHVRQEDKAFMADFYKYGFVGLVLSWIKEGMKKDPSEIVKKLNTLILGDLKLALKRFESEDI